MPSEPHPSCERAMLVDMGDYGWYYDAAIVEKLPDGVLSVRSVEGHYPRIVVKGASR